MISQTLQPAQADTILVAHTATTNYGTIALLGIGDASASADSAYRTLLQFDLSTIPAGAIVTGVTLSLYEYTASGSGTWAARLYRLLVPWTSSGATWNNRTAADAWGVPGTSKEDGDFSEDVSSTLTLDGTAAAGYVSWTGAQLIADVQGMIDGDYDNYGWVLIAADAEYQGAAGVKFNLFRSSNYGTAAQRPKLVVEYQMPSPATLLDVAHAWQLLVDGTDRWDNLASGALEWSSYEAGEVGTLRVTLKETGAALGIVEWQEIILKDGSTAIWGGYITQATPIADRMGNSDRLTWEISAESYETILNRSRRVRKTYHGDNPGDILVDLFDQALDPDSDPPNQTEFDTSTYVTTGTWTDDFTFAVDGEKLTDALDRLALLAGYVWWVDASKKVHFGAPSAATAPFGIKLAGDADYSDFFPPVANTVDAKVDASDIRNAITVQGGVSVSAVTSDTFTGDGSTLIFRLDYFPIVEIVAISVGGVVQSFGTDWYHSFDDYDCLVNYSHGTVRWDTGNAPPNLDSIIVAYRYGQQTVVRVTDATSIAQYGRRFEYEIIDRSITSAATAAAVGNAMLDTYAYGLVNGAFSVNRLGIEAGQRVQIEFAALSLTGYYQVRRVVGQLRKRGLVTLTVQFGGKTRRLSNVFGGNTGGGPIVPAPGVGGAIGVSDPPGATAKDQYGLQLTVPDYGSAERDEITEPADTKHIRFKNSSDQVLHRIDASSDTTSTGAAREVLVISGSGGVADKYGYTLLQTIAQREAWTRLRAVGGYGDAGQQDASLHLYAFRKNGLWDHSRAYLEADTVQVKQWAESAAPDPGTDSLPDGLLVYTDGTWNPGSGEGWYIRINAAWRPIAVVAGAVMQIGATLDLLDYHLRSVGNLEFANANTQQSNFNAGANTVYVVGTGSGNVTATLPQLSTIGDSDVRIYVFIKVSADANQMIIDGYGSETINGATTQSTTTQYTVFRVMSRGTEWLLW